MLVWSTEMPLHTGKTVEDVLNLAKHWLAGSPHNKWTIGDLNDDVEGEFLDYEKDGESVRLIKILNGIKSIGFRYEWTEDNSREWLTEIVAFEKKSKTIASVRVHCNFLNPDHRKPKVRKPYIVKQILQTLGGGEDGLFSVTDKPIVLREVDVDHAASIITGQSENKLPIIYASSTWEHKPAIDAKRIAQWASGQAHVVVEPSRHFSFALARVVERTNPYGGAVSIYWPNGACRPIRFLPENFKSPSRLATEVADCIQQAGLHLRPTPECTWGVLEEQVFRRRIDSLKEQGSTQINDYIDAFDAEISAKDERIRDAEKEISRLKAELQCASAAADAAETGILMRGEEVPFYPGEIRDAVCQALEFGKSNFLENGRRRHIIDDLLRANNISEDQENIEDGIKSSLNSASNFGRGEEKALESLGFTVTEEGKKHIKIFFHDERYSFTVQKTGSDWRGMKNLSSEIIRKLFK